MKGTLRMKWQTLKCFQCRGKMQCRGGVQKDYWSANKRGRFFLKLSTLMYVITRVFTVWHDSWISPYIFQIHPGYKSTLLSLKSLLLKRQFTHNLTSSFHSIYTEQAEWQKWQQLLSQTSGQITYYRAGKRLHKTKLYFIFYFLLFYFRVQRIIIFPLSSQQLSPSDPSPLLK